MVRRFKASIDAVGPVPARLYGMLPTGCHLLVLPRGRTRIGIVRGVCCEFFQRDGIKRSHLDVIRRRRKDALD